MLARLTIQNYTIIDRLEIGFSGGLNIITGETGAGKSIIIGALGLILGDRADKKSLHRSNGKCVIEGSFQIAAYGLGEFFTANDLDYDPETTLRREITADGKSRRSEEHTSELQSLMSLSYAVFCLNTKKITVTIRTKELIVIE